MKLYSQSLLDSVVVKVGGRDWNVDFTLDEEVEFHQLEDGLRHYLDKSHGWFEGEAVTVNVGRRTLSTDELSRLRQVFEEEFRLKVAQVKSVSETVELAVPHEAETPIVPAQPGTPRVAEEPQGPVEAPLFIKKTCRSGYAIHHNGDVIVLGDVNPGAEITASGDIVVLGALRGIAHAGVDAADPPKAIVIALSLRPIQLRIGRHVSVAPSNGKGSPIPDHPEIAYVGEGSIVVAPFTGGFRWLEERKMS